jgi:hypothetical protein
MDYETLIYDVDDHVVTLTYNRPHQHNAINRVMNSELHQVLRGIGRPVEERLRIEAEMIISMFMRRDPHTLGAAAFKRGELEPRWPHHGL